MTSADEIRLGAGPFLEERFIAHLAASRLESERDRPASVIPFGGRRVVIGALAAGDVDAAVILEEEATLQNSQTGDAGTRRTVGISGFVSRPTVYVKSDIDLMDARNETEFWRWVAGVDFRIAAEMPPSVLEQHLEQVHSRTGVRVSSDLFVFAHPLRPRSFERAPEIGGFVLNSTDIRDEESDRFRSTNEALGPGYRGAIVDSREAPIPDDVIGSLRAVIEQISHAAIREANRLMAPAPDPTPRVSGAAEGFLQGLDGSEG